MWLWHCGLGFGVICDGFGPVVVIGEAEDGGVCWCKYSLFPMKNETIFMLNNIHTHKENFAKERIDCLYICGRGWNPG